MEKDEGEEKSDVPLMQGQLEDALRQCQGPVQFIISRDGSEPNITQKNYFISDLHTEEPQKIRVFSIFTKADGKKVKAAEEKCPDYIEFVNGYEELSMHNGKLETLKKFDYVMAFLSVKSLKDFNFLCRILDQFKYKNNKNRYIPVILDEELYDPRKRAEFIRYWRNEIEAYKNEFLEGSYSEMLVHDWKQMQSILNILDDFILYAVNKDKFLSMDISDKIRKMVERRE